MKTLKEVKAVTTPVTITFQNTIVELNKIIQVMFLEGAESLTLKWDKTSKRFTVTAERNK